MVEFTHLHAHSDHSLKDAPASVEDIVKHCKESGFKSVAITDHGTASGMYAFWRECKENGIKPIVGVEAYTAKKLKVEDEKGKVHKDTTYHTVLLAKDEEGYKQICRLLYKANTETFYYKPIILIKDLLKVTPGHIVITTACIGGLLNRMIEVEGYDAAYEMATKFQEHFKEDFYIELQINELQEQKVANENLLSIANKLGIKKILTNDCHYIEEEDVILQDFLYMLRSNSTISQPKMTPSVRHSTYCSYEDFLKWNIEDGYRYPIQDIDSWLLTTNEIAAKCNFDFDTKSLKFPKYDGDKPSNELLRDRVLEEISKKGLDSKKEYMDRLVYELRVLCDKGYSDYFLIFDDIYSHAKEKDIWTSPGRGSAAGCLVSYLLGITKIDPIRFGLMFERFLDPSPDSKQLPDIDTDWDSNHREYIKTYIEKRWGTEHVCSVGTVSQFHMRGVLRDASRVYEINLQEVNDFLKKLDDDLPKKYQSILDYLIDLSETKSDTLISQWLHDTKRKKIIKIADKLNNHIRHRGKHAAALVVFANPIYDYIPVDSMAGEKGKRNVISAFSGGQDDKQLEELQTLKLDILGLNTVSILKKTSELVKERQGKDITKELLNIDVEDKALYDKIKDGRNIGVFQFESKSINNLIRAVKPKKFTDVIAISSLHRPGQIDFAYDYATNALDEPPHPIINNHTQNTRGVIIYQEQLMQIIADFMGVSLGATNLYRKILGGKGIDPNHPSSWNKKLKKFAKEFYVKTSAKHPDLTKNDIVNILRYLLKYAGYGFNFSHALCYSYIGLQTLYCKIYYPSEFYCAALNQSSDEEDYAKFLEDAQMNGITILPISFTESKYNFSIENDDEIRIGFRVLKGFGEIAYKELIKLNRGAFTNITDLLIYPWSKFNKTSMKGINNVGGFSCFDTKQEKIAEAIETLTAYDKTCIKKNKFDRPTDKLSFVFQSPVLESYSDIKKAELAQKSTGFNYYHIIQQNGLLKKLSKIHKILLDNSLPTFDSFDDVNHIVCGAMITYEIKLTQNKKEYLLITISDGKVNNSVKVWKHSIKDKRFTYSFDKFVSACYNKLVAFELDYDQKWGWSLKRVRKIFGA